MLFLRDEKCYRCCGNPLLLVAEVMFGIINTKNAVWIKIPAPLRPRAFWKIHCVFDISFVWSSSPGRNTGHQCFMGGALSMIKSWAVEQTEMGLIMDSRCRRGEKTLPLSSETFFCGNASFTRNRVESCAVVFFSGSVGLSIFLFLFYKILLFSPRNMISVLYLLF